MRMEPPPGTVAPSQRLSAESYAFRSYPVIAATHREDG
jgi:hypothetical protein